MKKILLYIASGLALISCSNSQAVDLSFEKSEDIYILPKDKFEVYAKAIAEADTKGKAELIDRGYRIADSLSLELGSSATLCDFADGMAMFFFAVNSPLVDEQTYRMALDREKECKCLEPTDFKRIAWKQSVVDNNAPGFRIANLPLDVVGGEHQYLLDLIDKTTVIFVYGHACDACEKLTKELAKSSVLAKAAEAGEIDLLTIYAADEDNLVPAEQVKLEGWKSCIDNQCVITYGSALDTRLIPSVYVVSHDGIVILRGSIDVKQVEKVITEPVPETLTIDLKPGEKFWGGRIADGDKMPYADGFSTTMHANSGNQVQPLLLSNKGRYVWCDDPFDFQVDGDKLILTNLTSRVKTAVVGTSLRDAYYFSNSVFYEYNGQLPPVEFFEKPQYNTWIELQYNQNQADVLKYAHGIVDHGLPPGIIMIDDTWMEDYGKWVFHPGRFPDPKAMCDELHRMGFKLMLWVCPFVSMDQYQIWAELCGRDAFLKTQDGHVYPVEWWNGVSAELDLSNPSAVEWFDDQLQYLVKEYGVDGFKFDAGDFNLWPEVVE